MEKKIRAKIPVEFKQNFQERFDVDRVIVTQNRPDELPGYKFKIERRCDLCHQYFWHGLYKCFGCPMRSYSNETVACCRLIEDVLGTEDFSLFEDIIQLSLASISWAKENNDEARRIMKKLVEEGEGRIEWIS